MNNDQHGETEARQKWFCAIRPKRWSEEVIWKLSNADGNSRDCFIYSRGVSVKRRQLCYACLQFIVSVSVSSTSSMKFIVESERKEEQHSRQVKTKPFLLCWWCSNKCHGNTSHLHVTRRDVRVRWPCEFTWKRDQHNSCSWGQTNEGKRHSNFACNSWGLFTPLNGNASTCNLS